MAASAKKGAGPVTPGIDIGVTQMIVTHAAAVHGLDISPEPVDLARIALQRLGLIGKGTERGRSLTMDRINRLWTARQTEIPEHSVFLNSEIESALSAFPVEIRVCRRLHDSKK